MNQVNIWATTFHGYSMYPALKPGDILIVKKVDGKRGNIKLGDIVCFPEKERQKHVAHRIIDIRESENALTVTTKGDNMTNPDTSQVLNSDGILKVVMIKRERRGLIKPRFGGALACLSSLNLTFGIIKGWIGRGIKPFIGR